MPKPFERPSISLSDGPKRAWQQVSPSLLSPGDLVAGVGTVASVKATPTEQNVLILGKYGGSAVVPADGTVFAFVLVQSLGE